VCDMATKSSPPHLTVADEPEPIALCALSIDVRVAGTLAELVWDMTFRNPHGRMLECELQFPLPDDAVVSGYGVEMNGEIVDAVPVEKETARVAFEAAVREGRDAGLVEAAKGNVFTTRVYPVPPNGTKRVRVAYELQLTAPSLLIPLCSAAPLDELAMHALVLPASAAVAGPSLPPRINDAGDLSGLAFNGTELSAHYTNVLLTKPVVVGLPALEPAFAPTPAADSKPEILVASDPAAESDAFFIVNDPMTVPDAADASSASSSEQQSKRVALFYDASLSRDKHDKAAEAGLLRRVLEFLADPKQGVDTVDLVIFRNAADEPKTFSITPGTPGIDEIIGAIEGSFFDGGTMLQCLEMLGRLHAEHPYRMALLWTDGLATLGREMPGDTAFVVPVHVFCIDPKNNPELLAFIAQKSGGAFHNTTSPLFAPAAALAALARSRQFGFIGAECGDGVTEVFPAHPVPITVSGRFTVAGRLSTPAKGGSLVLCYGFGSTVSRKVTVAVPPPPAASSVVARFWARKKVAELEVFGDKHKADIAALGRKYCFVTPGTSLLVLESLEQYQRYGITPSKRGLPKIHADFVRQKQQAEDEEDRRVKAKLDEYVSKWHGRCNWWATKRPSLADKMIEDLRRKRNEARESRLQQERERIDRSAVKSVNNIAQNSRSCKRN